MVERWTVVLKVASSNLTGKQGFLFLFTSILCQHESVINSIKIPNSGSLASSHAMFDTPFPIQALRLSKIEPTHYLHGRSLETSGVGLDTVGA